MNSKYSLGLQMTEIWLIYILQTGWTHYTFTHLNEHIVVQIHAKRPADIASKPSGAQQHLQCGVADERSILNRVQMQLVLCKEEH